VREGQGNPRGAANAGRKSAAVLAGARRPGGKREQGAKGSGNEAKAKILAKLRRLHPMD
jgi:hypothetical protein